MVLQPLWQSVVTRPRPKGKNRRDKMEWTEREVFKRLPFPFPYPAFCVLPQVASGTGESRKKRRTVDALAVSCFPSRGLYLAGIEIKVTKTDFRKELRDPSKSEDILRFCRFFYIAAPTGIIPLGELPETWGLVEVRADGATITKAATAREAETPDMPLLCAILRSASRWWEEQGAQGKAAEPLSEDEEELS